MTIRNAGRRKRDVEMAPLNTRIPKSLRMQLEESRQESGRSMADEVEARLAMSFGMCRSEDILVLQIDSGLMAHLKALQACHFVGDLEDTVVFLIRNQLIDYFGTAFGEMMAKHLPAKYQKSFCEAQSVYRAMHKSKVGRSL